MKKLRYDLGVFYRSLRRNRPAGRFKEAHPKNLLKRLKGFCSRGGIFAIIGPMLLTAVLCVVLYEIILTVGRGFRAITPSVSAAEPDSGSNSQSPLDFVLERFKSDDQKKAEADAAFQKAQRQLKAALDKSISACETSFLDVEERSARFDGRVQKVVGAPLNARPVPDDLAWVITLQPTAADAWTTIQRDRISDGDIENASNRLKFIEQRVAMGEYTADDTDSLKDLESALTEFSARIAEEESALTHINALLEARRYATHITAKGS